MLRVAGIIVLTVTAMVSTGWAESIFQDNFEGDYDSSWYFASFDCTNPSMAGETHEIVSTTSSIGMGTGMLSLRTTHNPVEGGDDTAYAFRTVNYSSGVRIEALVAADTDYWGNSQVGVLLNGNPQTKNCYVLNINFKKKQCDLTKAVDGEDIGMISYQRDFGATPGRDYYMIFEYQQGLLNAWIYSDASKNTLLFHTSTYDSIDTGEEYVDGYVGFYCRSKAIDQWAAGLYDNVKITDLTPVQTTSLHDVTAPPDANWDIPLILALDNVKDSSTVDINGVVNLGNVASSRIGMGEENVLLPSTLTLDATAVADAIVAVENASAESAFITLKLDYDDQLILDMGIRSENALRPYWWNADAEQWVLGGTTTDGEMGAGVFAGVDVNESEYGLGYFGVNTTENYIWLNVNHASTYGVAGLEIVPEPATLGLLAVGGLALLRRRPGQVLRRRKKS